MQQQHFETITYRIEDGVALITLNRPDKLNVFNTQMMNELVAAFDLTDADDDVGAVIVTGAGRAFCAGVDISIGGSSFDHSSRGEEPQPNGIHRDRGGRVTLRMFESLKPIIGAVNGAAVGIGATMLLPMDFRMAVTTARFGFLFARRGLVPEAASSWFLPKLVPIQTALDWCFTGRMVSADEAKDAGLLKSLHDLDDLLPAARAFARQIIENTSPVSVALTRQMIWRMAGADHPMEAHKIDSRAVQFCGKSQDAREGIAAFLEKRSAHFPGYVSTDMPEFFPWWQPRNFE